MAKRKRTIWIPLDVDLASKLEARGEPLSSQVDRAVRSQLTQPDPSLTSPN
jgi:hypothetical protein